MVRSAEIILMKILPWVDSSVQGEIHEWFVSKEDYVACVLSEPEGPWYDFLLPKTYDQIEQLDGHNNDSQVCAPELSQMSSKCAEPLLEEEEENSNCSSGSGIVDLCIFQVCMCKLTLIIDFRVFITAKEITEEEEDECEKEPEDSDDEEDFEDEDDESSGSNTEALLTKIESNFKATLDEKIEEAETFFDQHEISMSAIPPNVELTNIPPASFVGGKSNIYLYIANIIFLFSRLLQRNDYNRL